MPVIHYGGTKFHVEDATAMAVENGLAEALQVGACRLLTIEPESDAGSRTTLIIGPGVPLLIDWSGRS